MNIFIIFYYVLELAETKLVPKNQWNTIRYSMFITLLKD